jgi:hypothetical protein
LVPDQRFHLVQLWRVASRTGAPVRGFANEIVGRVALLALDTRVERLVARGVLVARAAIAHARAGGVGGMGIVAADAGAHSALFGVVRMLIGMTAGASSIGAALNVVRGVAVRAVFVARGVAPAEHRQIFMATPASDRLLFPELVGLVAADARHVPAVEQGCRRHQGLAVLMARSASGERLRAGGVLLLMASRANLIGRLAVDRVRWLDVSMAVLANTRLRRRIFMGPVAIQALAAVVDSNCRRDALVRRVAVNAVARLMRVQLQVLRRALEGADARVIAEAVTQRAVALEVRVEARASLGCSMSDARFFLVAARAA